MSKVKEERKRKREDIEDIIEKKSKGMRHSSRIKYPRIVNSKYVACIRNINIETRTDNEWIHECLVNPSLLDEWEEKHGNPIPKDCLPYKTAIGKRAKSIKEAINDIFVREILKLYDEPEEEEVLILDAAKLQTSNLLYKHGFRKIDIPNPYDCRPMNKNLSKGMNEVKIYPLTVGRYISGLKNGPKYVGIWLDYMGCFTGNVSKKQFPKEDVKTILDKGLLKSPSILAITTSLRCGEEKDQLKSILNYFANVDSDYCFKQLLAGRYHGKSGRSNMGIVIFLVRYENEFDEGCDELNEDYLSATKFETKIGIPLDKYDII